MILFRFVRELVDAQLWRVRGWFWNVVFFFHREFTTALQRAKGDTL